MKKLHEEISHTLEDLHKDFNKVLKKHGLSEKVSLEKFSLKPFSATKNCHEEVVCKVIRGKTVCTTVIKCP